MVEELMVGEEAMAEITATDVVVVAAAVIFVMMSKVVAVVEVSRRKKNRTRRGEDRLYQSSVFLTMSVSKFLVMVLIFGDC